MKIQSEKEESYSLYGQDIVGRLRLAHRDGRQLSWLELGAPDGVPVIYSHGNPGSRAELCFFHHQARRAGVRLLCVERPGFGDSAFDEHASLKSVAEDMAAVADLHSIDQAHTLGWSSGGPPALAMAYYFPQRVKSAMVLSSYTNFGEMENARALMEQDDLVAPKLAEKTPHIFHGLVRAIGWTSRHLPSFYLGVAEAEVSESDQQVLQDKSRESLFIESQELCFKQGADGAIRDLEVQWDAWPFSLTDIEKPVSIYQGKKDVFVPWQFAEHLHDSIPGSKLRMMPNEGHLYSLEPDFQREVFSEFAG